MNNYDKSRDKKQNKQSPHSFSSRFVGFDILKFMCAFFIVCIHTPFPGVAGEYFTALTRIAVPIFFIITGFYFPDLIRRGKCAAQIKKILTLVIVANLLYLVWNCFYTCAAGKSVLEYLQENLTLRHIAKFIIFNESPFGGHLWYLGAAVYVLLIAMAAVMRGGGIGNKHCTYQCQYSLSGI